MATARVPSRQVARHQPATSACSWATQRRPTRELPRTPADDGGRTSSWRLASTGDGAPPRCRSSSRTRASNSIRRAGSSRRKSSMSRSNSGAFEGSRGAFPRVAMHSAMRVSSPSVFSELFAGVSNPAQPTRPSHRSSREPASRRTAQGGTRAAIQGSWGEDRRSGLLLRCILQGGLDPRCDVLSCSSSGTRDHRRWPWSRGDRRLPVVLTG
jgi:hypothetical protein